MISQYSRHQREVGAVNPWILTSVIFGVLTIGLAVFSVYSFSNYMDQKTNVDTKISAAKALAVKTQADKDEANFLERDKQPNRQFVGPDDYGRLTFDYPKTWSVYIAKEVQNAGDTYQAYLNPVSVPEISDTQIYALTVQIATSDYQSTLNNYSSLVKQGKLTSSSVTINGATAVRLDGQFNNNIRGSLVIFKIRDKTVTIQTDASTFTSDFNSIITSIKFNS